MRRAVQLNRLANACLRRDMGSLYGAAAAADILNIEVLWRAHEWIADHMPIDGVITALRLTSDTVGIHFIVACAHHENASLDPWQVSPATPAFEIAAHDELIRTLHLVVELQAGPGPCSHSAA